MKPNIIDVRHMLPSHATGGSGQVFAPKRGVVIHYSGPKVDVSADTMDVLASYARFHMGPYLGERGIAYHYDVGNDAKIRLLRDPDAVLWHCGSWPENRTHYAVHVMIGGEQRATAAQLAALTVLVDWLREQDGIPRANVKGHQEVSKTSCPGTLMEDFVYPYRGAQKVADGFYFPKEMTGQSEGHYVGGGFWRFWQANGGLPIFGYPLSEEMQENGQTVQYFERAVFEYHPDQPEPYRVLLRRLGADALARVDAA